MKPGYRHLVRENAALKRQIENMRGSLSQGNERANGVILDGMRRKIGFASKNYFLYLKEFFFGSSAYYAWRNICRAFRPAMYLWRVLRIALIIMTYIQTSAVYLIFALLLLCTVPFFIIISLSQAMFVIFSGKRTKKRIEQALAGKRAAIFFCPKSGQTLDDTLNMLCERGYIVFCIFGITDLRRPGFGILTGVFKAGKDVFYIRSYYYFFIKKIFKTKCDEVVYIY